MTDFDLGSLEVSNGGLDAFLGGNPEVTTPLTAEDRTAAPQVRAANAALLKKPQRPGRKKLGSVEDLNGFVRVAEDTLVHKSSRELWALRQDGGGDFYIERMFDDMGGPLKG